MFQWTLTRRVLFRRKMRIEIAETPAPTTATIMTIHGRMEKGLASIVELEI
jgi:hypothetical protein